jgi:hypothetical protein
MKILAATAVGALITGVIVTTNLDTAPEVVQLAPVAAAVGPETTITTAYVTGYTWFDNTPSGNDISNPVIHQGAGGVGSFADPTTVAVGHSKIGSKDVLDYAPGTKFYVPSLRRYLIVEDTCGDGPLPQNGPCHRLDKPSDRAKAGATIWIDVWINGKETSRSKSDTCAQTMTDIHTVVLNPAPNYLTASGTSVMHDGKCDSGYGETVTTVPPPTPVSSVPPTAPSCAPPR